jgi:hypothetical protein
MSCLQASYWPAISDLILESLTIISAFCYQKQWTNPYQRPSRTVKFFGHGEGMWEFAYWMKKETTECNRP